MKKILSITLITVLLGVSIAGCKKDSEFLDIPPIQILPNDVVFSDPALVLSNFSKFSTKFKEGSNRPASPPSSENE